MSLSLTDNLPQVNFVFEKIPHFQRLISSYYHFLYELLNHCISFTVEYYVTAFEMLTAKHLRVIYFPVFERIQQNHFTRVH